MKQDQETLGRYLKRERETRHVTVEEIALFVGVKRSLADALEADDFDCFSRRSECLRLVKQYTAYLSLDPTEAVRRFDAQWKLSGDLKRYPKLTQVTDCDASSPRRPVFGGKKPFAHTSIRMGWLSLIVGLLIVVPLLFLYLSDRKPGFQPLEPSPPSGVEERAAPAAERVLPAAVTAPIRDGAPRRAPAIDPLYSPPGRSERKPGPPPKDVRVVGNRDTKRYHLLGMKYYDKVKAYHRVIFHSEREAVRAGYVKARE